MRLFTCLRAIRPKGYQLGILEKSYQKGEYLKQAVRKSYPPTRLEPAAFRLLVQCSTT